MPRTHGMIAEQPAHGTAATESGVPGSKPMLAMVAPACGWLLHTVARLVFLDVAAYLAGIILELALGSIECITQCHVNVF